MKSTIAAIALMSCLLTPTACAGASASAPARTSDAAHHEAAQRGSVALSGSPGVPGANANKHTLYVPIQCPASFCRTPAQAHVVDVIDTARCNASVVSGCRVLAQIPVGKDPLYPVVDATTDTIYVVNGPGSVSVVDGARCNATVRSGCSRATVATITTGGGATTGGTVVGALDPRTHTLYVASLNGYVFAVDVAACTATVTSGCHKPVRRIKDSLDPDAVAVDFATDTVYAANTGPMGNGSGDTVSVIDGARCNGSVGSGCGARARLVQVGSNPQWVTIDQATNTVYVTNTNDGTVSVIDGARCNATVGAGCAHTPPVVVTGAGPGYIAIDEPLHTAFVMNSGDDTLSALDTQRCTGAHAAGCGAQARSQQAGVNQDPGYAQYANQFALIAGTGTAYMVDEGGSNVLAVLDVRGCTATSTSTCRHPAPSVQDPEFDAALDPSTNTIYASNQSRPQIDVIDAATCHAGALGGCKPVATVPVNDAGDTLSAIDGTNHTLYAAAHAGTLELIDTATCNAYDTAGCATKPATVKVGAGANHPAVNAATQSLYVVTGMNGNQVKVINAATCNAQVMSGCGQPPATVTVGVGTGQLAVDAATNTIYAPSFGQNASGNTVDVINGATCNGTVHSGCAAVAAMITVGMAPTAVAVDDATHTLYVANNADGDHPGSVTIINSATCNATQTAGCAAKAAIPIGRAALRVAVDASTNEIYITNTSSATVSIINGASCNATVTTGCAKPAAAQAVGSGPNGLLVDPATDTVYAFNTLGSGSTSIFAGTP
jgi:DNA-binding beta-propeller fold protein YncE